MTTTDAARRTLFSATSVNPALAVIFNDYERRAIRPLQTTLPAGLPRLLSAFVSMKPRVMFTIGALLRALQLTTPIRWVFDPTCGIGAGINLLCYWSNAKWPAAIVLGYMVSLPFWSALGTGDGPAPPAIPIVHANTLNLTNPTGVDGASRPLRVDSVIRFANFK